MILKRIGCMLLVAMIAVSALGCEKEAAQNDESDEQIESELPNENEAQADDVAQKKEDFCVKTSFVDLYFPQKWKDQVTVTQTSDISSCTVTFFGMLDGRDTMKLFDLFIGKEGEIPIGVLKVDSIEMPVNLTFGELDYDESWSQSEIDTICAMQEDVNYLLDLLAKEPDFTEMI